MASYHDQSTCPPHKKLAAYSTVFDLLHLLPRAPSSRSHPSVAITSLPEPLLPQNMFCFACRMSLHLLKVHRMPMHTPPIHDHHRPRVKREEISSCTCGPRAGNAQRIFRIAIMSVLWIICNSNSAGWVQYHEGCSLCTLDQPNVDQSFGLPFKDAPAATARTEKGQHRCGTCHSCEAD